MLKFEKLLLLTMQASKENEHRYQQNSTMEKSLPLRSYLFSVQVKTTNKCAAGQKFVQWATVPKMHVLYKLNLHTSDSIAAMVFVFE